MVQIVHSINGTKLVRGTKSPVTAVGTQSVFFLIQLDGKNLRLISGLAELSRKVKNTVNIRLSANVHG